MSRSHLSQAELADLHSVLRRAAERAERRRNQRPEDAEAEDHAERLAAEVANLARELERT